MVRNALIDEDCAVCTVNSAVYAMQMLQKEMEREAQRAVLLSDDDIMELVKELRY